MKNLRIFISIFAFNLIILAQQSPIQKKVNVKLNALDFSRYPKVDLYVTLNNNSRNIFSADLVKKSLTTVNHNGKNFTVQNIAPVLDLKKKGETEFYISMIFDNSMSMIDRNNLLEEGAKVFVNGIKKGDYVNFVDFGADNFPAEVTIPEFPEKLHVWERIGFSNSKYYLLSKIHTTEFTKRTYLYDALLYSISQLNSTPVLGKKAVILFSDGRDIGSSADFNTVFRLALNYSIPIYSLDLSPRPNSKLKLLSEKTGGNYYFVKKPEELLNLYKNLSKLLQNQFRVTYLSDRNLVNSDIQRVNVNLNGPLRGKAVSNFVIKGSQIGFYNLVYTEKIGNENVKTYLNYLMAFPHSKFFEKTELLLGNYWKKRGEFAKAKAVLDQLLINKNSSIYYDALASKAELLILAKDYEGSRKAYSEIIKSKVTTTIKPKALFNLASSFNREGNYESALETYSSLVENYQGTEWASEGLLKSSTINIQLGNLDNAAKSLKTIVDKYSDSKSAVYAKFELAKLYAKKGNLEDAKNLFSEVARSAGDNSLKSQSTLNLAKLLLQSSDYENAVSLLTPLTSNNLDDPFTVEANLLYFKALANQGNNLELSRKYFALPPSMRQNIFEKVGKIIRKTDRGKEIILPNGAAINGGENVNINVFKNEDFAKKYAVAGNAYKVTTGDSSFSEIKLPVNKNWFKSINDLKKAGVYYYDTKNFIKIDSLALSDSLLKIVKVNKSGIYSVLMVKPIVIRLFNIYFDLAKATIRKNAEKNLYQLIDYLKSHPDVKIEIAGHTDSTGTAEFNYKLSLARANAIKNFMMHRGISSERLIARGYGSQFPIASNINERNRQLNRRTEFIVLAGGKGIANNKKKTVRYVVLIKTFLSVKDAYNFKQFISKHNFKVTVLSNNASKGESYSVVLGIFNNKETAIKEQQRFVNNFKNYKLVVKNL